MFPSVVHHTDPPRRIFVIPGTYDCANIGDVTMLQVAVTRLKSMWPQARLDVLARDADALKAHCPDAHPVPQEGIKLWMRYGALPAFMFPDVPLGRRKRFPASVKHLLRSRRLWRTAQRRQAQQFVESLFNADLVVLAGCGMISDAFADAAGRVLNLLALAQRCEIPVVMFSQGIGPIEDAVLYRRAADVLPKVKAIFLREKRASLPLLKTLAVPAKNIFITGDDAIEPAFADRPQLLGNGIGVNLRVSGYSGIAEASLQAVRDVLSHKARQLQTTLKGIPILCRESDSDTQTIQRLLPSGVETDNARPKTSQDVIKLVSGCRLVVTGSYHAGVFALAQGIPVVAIVQSAYYRAKFLGLAEQFGGGCIVLSADDARFADNLNISIEQFWRHAHEFRPGLLAAARQQIKAGQTAYAQLPALLGSVEELAPEFALDPKVERLSTEELWPRRQKTPR